MMNMATVGRLALPAKRITNFASRFNQLDGLLERKYCSYLRFANLKQSAQLFSTNVYQRQNTESPHFQASAQLKEISIDHFGREGNTSGDEEYRMPHPVWSEEDVYSVEVSHEAPEKFVDKLAYWSVQALRATFDVVTLYHVKELDENRWLNRIIMLETIAGVPGMIGAMTRHFHALRKLTRDNGWIHTLLEEAENERMHLMTALELKQPGIVFRGLILLAQGTFVNLFFLAYLLSPRFCHRFVGYLEEEAVKTYTHCLKSLDSGQLPLWQNQLAPKIAVNYWKLPEGSTMRDVILVIRADEAHHRVVNHTLSSMPLNAPNPFLPGKKKL